MCNGDAWGPDTPSCENCRICGIFGADFGIMGGTGWRPGHGNCLFNVQWSVTSTYDW